MLMTSAPRDRAVNTLENSVKMTKFSDKCHGRRIFQTYKHLTNTVLLILPIYNLLDDFIYI